MDDFSARYRVPPGHPVRLAAVETRVDDGLKRADAAAELETHRSALTALHDLLYVASTHAVLIILQGIDASGKDGVIRNVFTAFNPAGCRVISFKAPTPLEARHDYLWRIHKNVPAHGEIVVFNRSHYESVLVERVHGIVPADVWAKRYSEINGFEQVLAESNTLLLKFFLHLSPEEQLERFHDRLNQPDKWWKLAVADWEDRERWNEYQAAFEEMLNRTSTDFAPWYVIPADRKWYRDLAIARITRRCLETLSDRWRAVMLEVGAQRRAEVKLYLESRETAFHSR
ncbi:MAG: polyphosphate kinase 2 family protein [Chloroflexota bacterium]|nr:polyphosphate kinase 2 family protein [Dehalococcoidia bacterium]MDW8253413.1 polyphosphate kinase 2 family protein [Chloroflexota bacterium]